MFRLVYLAFFTCVFLMFNVPSVLAQASVRVQLKDHKKYSRMIVEWGSRVPYTLKKTGRGKAVLGFEQTGRISPSTQGMVLRNMKNVRTISSSPLIVGFNYPADSRIREFYTDDRLIIDVFNSPSGQKFEAPKETSKKEADAGKSEKPEPQKIEIPKEENVAVSEEKLVEREKEDVKSEAVKATAIEPEDKVSEPKLIQDESSAPKSQEKQEEQEEQNAAFEVAEGVADVQPAVKEAVEESKPKFELKPTVDGGSSLITFSMNKATSMAAFRLRNQLWMIHNNPDSHVPPKVSGGQKDRLNALQSFFGKSGHVFITPAVIEPEMLVKGKGGGVLWDFVVADEHHSTPDTRTVNMPQVVFHEINGEQTASVEFFMKNASAMTEVMDPMTGWPIKIITAKTAENYVPERMEFVDFTVLPSPVGLAIVPKVDDLEILLTGRDVKIFRPDGLNVTGLQLSSKKKEKAKTAEGLERDPMVIDEPRVYAFNDWALSDREAINRNRIAVLASLNKFPEFKQAEQVKSVAKAYLAQGLGVEALGLLNWAKAISPDIENQPEFKALNGLANAFVSRPEAAYINLSDDSLNAYPEVGYWKAFVLANVGNWDLAHSMLPRSLAVLKTYPSPVFNRVANVVAEIYLRAGYPSKAKDLLDDMHSNKDTLLPEQRAALAYLQGEYARQRGDLDRTKKYWQPLFDGDDELYRAKAGLALTRLRVDKNDIPLKLALNNLERLRYAWRGDELEAQIHYWLGHTYYEDHQYARALNIMRDAAAMSDVPEFSENITEEMSGIFIDIFLNKKLEGVTPLDAATLYEQFSELAPSDEKENDVIEILANHLAKANLLRRATSLLQHQFEHRLSGEKLFNAGVRLSALYLLDNRPDKAVLVLEELLSVYENLPENVKTKERQDEMTLLRVEALSKEGEHNEALFLMDRMESTGDVNRLRADIAWRAGFWDDAADAMDKIIEDRKVSLARRISDTDRDLLIQYGVALNLANDRIGLTDLREEYGGLMAKTDKGDVFEIITRPRRTPGLADRQTLLSVVSETDLFGSFLESYKATEGK